MSQESQVLCCCACGFFQKHIVMKDTWVCGFCRQQQMLQIVYGKGNHEDCKNIITELNIHKMRTDKEPPIYRIQPLKYSSTEKYLESEKNPQTSRWKDLNNFNNGVLDAKKRNGSSIINTDEAHQNITEDLDVADTRNFELQNKINHFEHNKSQENMYNTSTNKRTISNSDDAENTKRKKLDNLESAASSYYNENMD